MKLLGVHHVSINVSDLDETLAFYTDVLGLPVLDRPTLRIDGRWLGLPDGRELHLVASDVPTDRGQHFAFEVDDVDAVIDHLDAAGHRTSTARVTEGICRQTFCVDPSGNRVEFNQRL